MRHAFLFLFLSPILCHGQSLSESALKLSESDDLRDGRFSFYATDLTNGDLIAAHDIDRKMTPASNMKVITTYAALDIMGAGHRFSTRIGYSGNITDDGVLEGDLIVEAGGDPTLDAEKFKEHYGLPLERKIIRALRDEGVKTIVGKLIIDEAYYTGIDAPDEWTYQDMGNYYGAGAHAFTFQENKYIITLKSSNTVGVITEVVKTGALLESARPNIYVKSAAIRSDQAYVYSVPHSEQVDVYGEIPRGKTAFEVKAAFSHPAAEFEAKLKKAFIESGIDYRAQDLGLVLHRQPDGSLDVQEILNVESPTLMEIAAYTNMKSNNLFAEHLLRQIGKHELAEGSFDAGAKAVMAWCAKKGISIRGLRVKDGSGLSRSNHVSTRFMIELLTSLASEPYFDEYRRTLPCAGKSGSMRRIGKDSAIAGKMYAKTGYIEAVRAYSGFLEKGDRIIAFSIIANDYDCSASQMRLEMEKLMVELGE